MKGIKIIKSLMLIATSCFVIYFVIYFYQNHSLKKSFAIEQEQEFDENFKFIRCNYNIFEPEFAFVFPFRTGGFISFERSNRFFYQTKEEWKTSSTGTTTIKNTTFPELIKMVKEDCSQFQKAKGDPNDKDINWSYGREKTEEEIIQEKNTKADEIRWKMSGWEGSELKRIIDQYGDWRKIEDSERLIDWYDQFEDDEYQRKIDSGEIIIKSREEQLKDLGYTEDEIQRVLNYKDSDGE